MLVRDDGAGVVQFVAGRYQQHVRPFLLQMLEIACLALLPGRFRRGVGVCTGAHDTGNSLAEFFPDGGFIDDATIFDHVMQQAGDGLIFVAAMLEESE